MLASEGLARDEPAVMEWPLDLAKSLGGLSPRRKWSSLEEEFEGDCPAGVKALRRVLRKPAGMDPGWMVSGPLILTAPLMPEDICQHSHLLVELVWLGNIASQKTR